MAIHKLKDWRGWWDGLRTSVMKAGATAITTYLTAFITTNGLAAAAGPDMAWFKNVGMSLKTALAGLVFQFGLHVLYSAAQYVQNKPSPDEVDADEKKPVDTNADSANGSGK